MKGADFNITSRGRRVFGQSGPMIIRPAEGRRPKPQRPNSIRPWTSLRQDVADGRMKAEFGPNLIKAEFCPNFIKAESRPNSAPIESRTNSADLSSARRGRRPNEGRILPQSNQGRFQFSKETEFSKADFNSMPGPMAESTRPDRAELYSATGPGPMAESTRHGLGRAEDVYIHRPCNRSPNRPQFHTFAEIKHDNLSNFSTISSIN